MGKTLTINIARDFSKYPGGRYATDGKFSGERFRDEFLVPDLGIDNTVTVELDGTLGYGSSFLEEAFGGLVRKRGFVATDLDKRLDIRTSDDDLAYTIRRYINDAKNQEMVSR